MAMLEQYQWLDYFMLKVQAENTLGKDKVDEIISKYDENTQSCEIADELILALGKNKYGTIEVIK